MQLEELDSDNEDSRRKSTNAPRPRTPRTSRATRRRKTKTTGGAFGGNHQRRNKHWSW